MGPVDRLKAAIFGDPKKEIVKAGTLAVTRGTGILVAAVLAAVNAEWPDDFTATQKLVASLIIVGLWVLVFIVDMAVRGYASGKEIEANGSVKLLPRAWTVSVPALDRDAEAGWHVVAWRGGAPDPAEADLLTVKGNEAVWRKLSELRLES